MFDPQTAASLLSHLASAACGGALYRRMSFLVDKLGETMPHGDTSSKIFALGGGPAATNPDAWIGRRLDRYELRALLGAGGMGVVYLAHDLIIERDVAMPALAGSPSSTSIVRVSSRTARRIVASSSASPSRR